MGKIKKYHLILMAILFSSNFISAELKISEKKIGKNEVIVYALNTDSYPYTIRLYVNATNVTLDRKLDKKIIVKPGATFQELVKISGGQGSYTYSLSYKYMPGNQLDAVHNNNYVYKIPVGDTYKVMQGYNGTFSHQDKKALDFDVPIGSKVFAARDGVVIDLKEDSDKGCTDASCMGKANFILIYHDDGTIGSYFHLEKNGAIVVKNQRVKKGDQIGYSGNTGWCAKPHLHFEVYTENNGIQQSVETKFQSPKGPISITK